MSVMRFAVPSALEEAEMVVKEDKFYAIRNVIGNGMVSYVNDDRKDFNKYSNGLVCLEYIYHRFIERYHLDNVSIELFSDWVHWLGY